MKHLFTTLLLINLIQLSYGQKETGMAPSVVHSYYISSSAGNDANDGLSPNTTWKTFKKISSMTFLPGDSILFKSGDIWSGDNTLLKPKGSGTSTAPIVIDKYGAGAKPVLSNTNYPNSSGGVFGAVMLSNQSNWRINNLEVIANNANALYLSNSNTSEGSIAGIYVKNTNSTIQSNITISNCTVKSFSNKNQVNTQAILGIGFEGAFNSILVDHCIIDSCLAGIHSNANLHYIYPANSSYKSKGITFSNNLLQNVWGNGLVIGSITNGLITNNRVTRTSWGNGACIWLTGSTNSIVQYNEVSDVTTGSTDGQSFDDDDDEGSSTGDIFQYNYSHNNAHGFMLIMPSCSNLTVRFNISINDGGSPGLTRRFFGLSPTSFNDKVSIYNNVFYIGKGITTRVFATYEGSGDGWVPKFYNNIIYIDGGSLAAFSESALNSASVFKNNCFYPASSFTSSANYFTNQTGLISSDPLFAGKANIGNNFGTIIANLANKTINFLDAIKAFTLQSGSPCINTGYAIPTNVVYDFANSNIKSSIPSVGAIWPTTATGISNFAKEENDFSVYPNPCNNTINILSNINHNAVQTLSVYDILGNQVIKIDQAVIGNEYSLNVENLQTGVYFLEWKDEYQPCTVHRVKFLVFK